MSKIIRVDVDGVVADLQLEWLSRINAEYGCDVTCDEITDWNMGLFLPPVAQDYHKHLHDLTLYEGVQPYAGAQEGISLLRKAGYRVVFVTSSTAAGAYGKMEWLKRYGFLPKGEYIPKDFVSAHDKTLVAPGSPLVDDGYHNIQKEAHGILIDQPWNRQVEYPFRAKTWAEVLEIADYMTEHKLELLSV